MLIPSLGNRRPLKVCPVHHPVSVPSFDNLHIFIATGQLVLVLCFPAKVSIYVVNPWHYSTTDWSNNLTVWLYSRYHPHAAPLPISPVLTSVSTPQLFYPRCAHGPHAWLQHVSFMFSQMESGCFSVLLAGTVPALAASLAVVAVFQLAGAMLACCLARYFLWQRCIFLQTNMSAQPLKEALHKNPEWQ